MENRRIGFFDYLDNLKKDLKVGKNIVFFIMNVNFFIFGY